MVPNMFVGQENMARALWFECLIVSGVVFQCAFWHCISLVGIVGLGRNLLPALYREMTYQLVK